MRKTHWSAGPITRTGDRTGDLEQSRSKLDALLVPVQDMRHLTMRRPYRAGYPDSCYCAAGLGWVKGVICGRAPHLRTLAVLPIGCSCGMRGGVLVCVGLCCCHKE